MRQTDVLSNKEDSSEMPKWLKILFRRATVTILMLSLIGTAFYFSFVLPRIVGTYSTDNGAERIEFHFDGTAIITLWQMPLNATYKIRGDNIGVIFPNNVGGWDIGDNFKKKGDELYSSYYFYGPLRRK